MLPEEPPHLPGGRPTESGAADCSWSDIKFYLASHLVVLWLPGEFPWACHGSGQAVLAWHDPPVTLRQAVLS